MKVSVKNIFFGIIVIAAFLLGTQTCRDTSNIDLKPRIDTLIVHTTDTIKDTTTVFKFKNKEVPVYIEVGPTSYSDVPCELAMSKRYYSDTYRDTNQTVTINDTIIGYLLHRDVSYKLFVPLKIYDSTKVTITKEIPVPQKPKFQLRVGVLANQNSINGLLDVQIKKITYTGGYDPINKRVSVGLKYTLFSK